MNGGDSSKGQPPGALGTTPPGTPDGLQGAENRPSGSKGKHIRLMRTLGNSSKKCLGPRKEVEITPVRGEEGREGSGWVTG